MKRTLPPRAIRASAIMHRGSNHRGMDASLRYEMHGPIRPMEEPGFFARLFGRL